MRYCIGDIHGHADALDRLLDLIAADARHRGAEEHLLVLIGDLIDRGPDSRGVVEHLLGLERRMPNFRIAAVKGNHERHLIRLIDREVDTVRRWVSAAPLGGGGEATLASYGLRDAESFSDEELVRLLPHIIPPGHLDLLRSLPACIVDGPYLFAHAGVRPGVALRAQSQEDLIEIREPFLSSTADHGRIVVHGHSPRRWGEIRHNRVNCDWGAGYGLQLACVVLPETYAPETVGILAVAAGGPLLWCDP